jgi:3-oxoacyl-[acyl-carrier-protein] synthase II
MSTEPRVVITGMGWVTPLGFDLQTVWAKLTAGASGVSRIDRFNATTFPTTFAGQIRGFDFSRLVRTPTMHRHAGLNAQFALGAAAQAWKQACLGSAPDLDRRRIGLYLGAGEGVLDFENYVRANLAGWDEANQKIDGRRWAEAALRFMRPEREIEQEPNMPAAHIAREFGLRGPTSNCLTACAASTQAIGEASSIIRRGDADVMVSGGTHTMLHVLGVTGFNRLTALSRRNDDMMKASRPFSRGRDGFVMGEGSGIVILETLDHAQRRGATPLAEIIGYGSSADAFRITDMHPDGLGPASAIRQALAQAAIAPDAVDAQGRPVIHYISAHGTGTKENDSIETKAVKAVFGEHARQIPMSSIKSMMGHLIAAAGAVELITCVLAIQTQTLPPTINLDDPDPDLDLDYVANVARRTPVETCLSNSFGFGGQNDTLIVRKFEGQSARGQ